MFSKEKRLRNRANFSRSFECPPEIRDNLDERVSSLLLSILSTETIRNSFEILKDHHLSILLLYIVFPNKNFEESLEYYRIRENC